MDDIIFFFTFCALLFFYRCKDIFKLFALNLMNFPHVGVVSDYFVVTSYYYESGVILLGYLNYLEKNTPEIFIMYCYTYLIQLIKFKNKFTVICSNIH